MKLAAPIRAYWWSPRREAALGVREIRRNPGMWLRLARGEGNMLLNFGDELNRLVLEKAGGRRVEWSPPGRAEVLGIGSIVEFYADRSTDGVRPALWGAGVRGTAMSAARAAAVRGRYERIVALRGPLSLSSLRVSATDVALGDPGVLAPRVVQGRLDRKGTGYLPHFRTWRTRTGRSEIARVSSLGVKVIKPTEDAESVLSKISGLEFLITSSLHGLIVAHAYGTPAIWVDIPGMAASSEPRFKFDDYLASMGGTGERHSTREVQVAQPVPLLRAAEWQSPRLAERAADLATGLMEAFPK